MEKTGTSESASEAAIDESGPSLTIGEFCLLENISRASFFKMQRSGVGPDVMHVPGTTIVRITAAQRKAWHIRMQELAQQEATTLERQRRVEHASRAGKAAVMSPLHVANRRRDRARRAE
jgi:hypothetical protein